LAHAGGVAVGADGFAQESAMFLLGRH
jgi:hypothetical protein